MKLRAALPSVESDHTKCKHQKSVTFWKDLLWQVATCHSVTQSRFLHFQKQLRQQMNWVLQHSTRISCLWSLRFNPVAGGKQKWEAQQCGRSSGMCSRNTGDRCWNATWMRRRMSVLFVRVAHLCQLKGVTEKHVMCLSLWLKIFVLLISKCFLSLSTPFFLFFLFWNQPSLLSPSRRYYAGQKQNKTNKKHMSLYGKDLHLHVNTTIHTFTNPNLISAPR